MKLVVFALVIVLALSIHTTVKHVISMTSGSMTENQLLSINIVYVLFAGIILWIIKVMNMGDGRAE